MTSDLVPHLARFAGALRGAGVRASIGDEVDGLRALVRLDLADREEVRRGLRCAFKVRRADVAKFDAAFDRCWGGQGVPEELPASPPQPYTGEEHSSVRPAARAGGPVEEREVPHGDEPGWSPEAQLRKKPFEECDAKDLAAMERMLLRLADGLATRRSRRLVPARGRGVVDLRRSLRRAASTGGELLSLARRAHPIETPRLVVLCDTSGSMEAHARFLLAFAFSLRRVARSTEVFSFNTRLTRITPWLRAGRLQAALEQLVAAVPDWSGGTRIGESLLEFAERFLEPLVDARTVVIVLSDGLDRGEPALIASAMRRIRARARRVLWLNPLLSDPRYQPTARGMAAALPFVDRLVPAHNLETLERLIPHLSL